MSKRQIAVVSPHRDDAAFSCGILMYALLAHVELVIVNIFTRSDYAPFAPEVERAGIDSVSDLRLQEDMKMIGVLKAMLPLGSQLSTANISEVDLGLLDAPLRLRVSSRYVPEESLDPKRFEEEIVSLTYILSPVLTNADWVLLPLGFGGTGLKGHIDHRIVREAGLRCTALERVAFYEDLPYSAGMPQMLRESALANFEPMAQGTVEPFAVRCERAASIKALLSEQYPSQVSKQTVENMGAYSDLRGGEVVYAGAHFRVFLEDRVAKCGGLTG